MIKNDVEDFWKLALMIWKMILEELVTKIFLSGLWKTSLKNTH